MKHLPFHPAFPSLIFWLLLCLFRVYYSCERTSDLRESEGEARTLLGKSCLSPHLQRPSLRLHAAHRLGAVSGGMGATGLPATAESRAAHSTAGSHQGGAVVSVHVLPGGFL